MKKASMKLAAMFRKVLGLKKSLKLAWDIIRGRAFSFFKKGDGCERLMQGIEVLKVDSSGLVLCLENGSYKRFYLENVIF